MRSLVREGLAVVLGVLAACAGNLEQPERFHFLEGAGGFGNAPDAATADAGATDTPDTGAPTVPGVSTCVIDTFASACGTAACHGAGAPQVDLVSDGVAARLVDQSTAAGGLCAGRVYVASDGSESLLLDKLSDAPPCGSKMPLVGSITAVQSQCLSDWVGTLGAGP